MFFCQESRTFDSLEFQKSEHDNMIICRSVKRMECHDLKFA